MLTDLNHNNLKFLIETRITDYFQGEILNSGNAILILRKANLTMTHLISIQEKSEWIFCV